MTITSLINSVDYVGNGVTREFTFPFRRDAEDSLRVIVNGVIKVAGAGYVIEGGTNGTIGGKITFPLTDIPAQNAVITIVRHTPPTQTVDFTANESFPADLQEIALDKLTMAVQDNLASTITRDELHNWDADGSKIINVGPPENAGDATTKAYVDGQVAAARSFSQSNRTLIDSNTEFTTPRTGGTGSSLLPVGDDSQRDVSATLGYTRFNTSRHYLEIFGHNGWMPVGYADAGGGQLIPAGGAQPAAWYSTPWTGPTGATKLPVGNSDQRPASPVVGMVRFNADRALLEWSQGGLYWYPVGMRPVNGTDATYRLIEGAQNVTYATAASTLVRTSNTADGASPLAVGQIRYNTDLGYFERSDTNRWIPIWCKRTSATDDTIIPAGLTVSTGGGGTTTPPAGSYISKAGDTGMTGRFDFTSTSQFWVNMPSDANANGADAVNRQFVTGSIAGLVTTSQFNGGLAAKVNLTGGATAAVPQTLTGYHQVSSGGWMVPTMPAGDNSDNAASTRYVMAAVAAGGGGAAANAIPKTGAGDMSGIHGYLAPGTQIQVITPTPDIADARAASTFYVTRAIGNLVDGTNSWSGDHDMTSAVLRVSTGTFADPLPPDGTASYAVSRAYVRDALANRTKRTGDSYIGIHDFYSGTQVQGGSVRVLVPNAPDSSQTGQDAVNTTTLWTAVNSIAGAAAVTNKMSRFGGDSLTGIFDWTVNEGCEVRVPYAPVEDSSNLSANTGWVQRELGQVETLIENKANINNPTLTGNVNIPTVNEATPSTKAVNGIALDNKLTIIEQAIQSSLSLKANLAGGSSASDEQRFTGWHNYTDTVTFTGTVSAFTPAAGDNSAKLATTQYVDRAVTGSGGGGTGKANLAGGALTGNTSAVEAAAQVYTGGHKFNGALFVPQRNIYNDRTSDMAATKMDVWSIHKGSNYYPTLGNQTVNILPNSTVSFTPDSRITTPQNIIISIDPSFTEGDKFTVVTNANASATINFTTLLLNGVATNFIVGEKSMVSFIFSGTSFGFTRTHADLDARVPLPPTVAAAGAQTKILNSVAGTPSWQNKFMTVNVVTTASTVTPPAWTYIYSADNHVIVSLNASLYYPGDIIGIGVVNDNANTSITISPQPGTLVNGQTADILINRTAQNVHLMMASTTYGFLRV